MDEVESLERATFAAVPPQRLETAPGWLVGIDDGTVGRAHSAVPIRHAAIDAASTDAVFACFAAHGKSPVFRVPLARAFDPVRARLVGRGLQPSQPTLTMTAARLVAAAGTTALVRLSATADEAFAAAFLGEDFEPRDAASRLAILRRAKASVFARVEVEGATVAVGIGGIAEGWLGIHGMRTLPAWRGRGLASAILAALARRAVAQGVRRAFLQVESSNPAQRLYRRAGLRDAWGYEYWRAGPR